MKKLNKKSERIREAKALKRNKAKKKHKQVCAEKLNMKANSLVKMKTALQEKYAELVNKQFASGD
jgi:hypothetical protein